MASFGLKTAADFLQKLRDEQKDFVQSNCLNPRHALNAVMTGYHLYEWVYPELASEPACPYKDKGAFLEGLKAIGGSPIEDARRITNGTKHFEQGKIKTGKRRGAFQRSAFQANAFDVSYLWLQREDGREQRAEDFIEDLVAFWENYFVDHGLGRYADGVGRAGRDLSKDLV